jgi:hypothetical protein
MILRPLCRGFYPLMYAFPEVSLEILTKLLIVTPKGHQKDVGFSS